VLPFLPSFLSIVAALVFPTIVGLLIISGVAKIANPKYIAAFALGLYFCFFSDAIGDAAYLDVNAGFGGGAVQVALVVLFVIGVLLVFSIDSETSRAGTSSRNVALCGREARQAAFLGHRRFQLGVHEGSHRNNPRVPLSVRRGAIALLTRQFRGTLPIGIVG